MLLSLLHEWKLWLNKHTYFVQGPMYWMAEGIFQLDMLDMEASF